MSIANLKDSGNKGNNVPYQLAVLQLLDSIATSSGGCCPTAATEATSLAILAAISAPASTVSDAYFEGATNAVTIVLYQAWKVSNPTSKVISRIMMVDNTTLTSGLYIEYI